MAKVVTEMHKWLNYTDFVSLSIPGPLGKWKKKKAILEEDIFEIKNKSVLITA